jgi:hypothetical protein
VKVPVHHQANVQHNAITLHYPSQMPYIYIKLRLLRFDIAVGHARDLNQQCKFTETDYYP